MREIREYNIRENQISEEKTGVESRREYMST